MKKKSTDRLSGNDRYEGEIVLPVLRKNLKINPRPVVTFGKLCGFATGFCIELIDQLANLLQFNYTFVEQPDGVYGNYNNTTRQWTGMMRRLRDDPVTTINFVST